MTINYWAIVVGAIVSMIVGSVWYGPLFGKMFISAMGLDKKSKEEREAMMKGMTMSYIWQFVASLVMFYVLSVVISVMGMATVMGGIQTALLLWIGFIVTVKLGDVLWGGKRTLFWLTTGNMLITLIAAGAIIGGWQ